MFAGPPSVTLNAREKLSKSNSWRAGPGCLNAVESKVRNAFRASRAAPAIPGASGNMFALTFAIIDTS